MKSILLLKPRLSYQLWGGDNLKKFNVELDDANDVSSAWLISGYKDRSSVILNGEFKNQTLYDVFMSHRDLFDNYQDDKYPLLVKFVDINWKMPIQVHPTDEYAKAHCHEFGGREKVFYVLKAAPGAVVVLGHTAKTKEELIKQVKEEKWEQLLIRKNVKEGDLIYIPAGCLHGLTEGLVMYELQYSSDPLYKLFNYNRELFDEAYKLDIEEALANITVPYVEPQYKHSSDVLIETDKFKLVKVVNSGSKKYSFPDARWVQATVINGGGTLNQTIELKTSVSFVVPSNVTEFEIEGNVTLLFSYVPKKK